jgi:hypothetical protein
MGIASQSSSNPGDIDLLYKTSPGKEETHWGGPCIVHTVDPNGYVVLSDGSIQSCENFKVFIIAANQLAP